MKLVIGSGLSKAGGPYIGPRGGRWADARHTVPWKENSDGETAEPDFANMGADAIRKIAKKIGESVPGIHVTGSMGNIFINHESRRADANKAINEAKQKIASYLLDKFKGHRTFKQVRSRGATLWNVRDSGGYFQLKRAGIEIVLTDEETNALNAGPHAWKKLMESKEQAPENMDKALYVGPRGGKWADTKHTIPWHETDDRRHPKEPDRPPLSGIKFGDDLPPGVWVHGRAGRGDLNTGTVIQSTKNWETASRYSGKNGSIWLLRVKKGEKILDARDEGVRKKLAQALADDWKSGSLHPGLDDMLERLKDNGEEDPAEKLLEELNPDDIVDSAGLHDSPEFTEWLGEKFSQDVAAVRTEDGLVVYNPDLMETQKVEADDAEKSARSFEKALYIGPRGGRWADAAHTIPFDPAKHSGKVTIQRRSSEESKPGVSQGQLNLIERKAAAQAKEHEEKREAREDAAIDRVRSETNKLTVSQPLPEEAKSASVSRKELAVEIGEHVWGSRKDRWALNNAGDLDSMSPDDQAKAATKSRLMPKLDMDALLGQEKTPGCILLRSAVEQAVASAAGNSLEARKLYVEGIDYLQRSLDACETAEDVDDFLDEWRQMSRGFKKGATYTAEQIEQAKDDIMDKRGTPVRMDWKERRRREAEIMAAKAAARIAWAASFVEGDPNHLAGRMLIPMTPSDDPELQAARQQAEQRVKDLEYQFRELGGDAASGIYHDRAVEFLTGRSSDETTFEFHRGGAVTVYVRDHDLSSSVRDNKYARMLAALGKRMVKLVGYRSEKQGKPYRQAHNTVHRWERDEISEEDQIEALSVALGSKKRGTRGERKPFRWERDVPGEIDRVGGRSVDRADPRKFAEDFGLANVQFGGWVSEEDADTHLRGAHGAMFDLSDVLGVDPKTVSLNGRLSIGFGARGGGQFRAHYEPSNQIINITKIAGGGSLAHEWAHAMDNIVSVASNPGSTAARQYMSDGDRNGVPGPVADAMQGVMDAIRYPDPVRAKEVRAANEMFVRTRRERRTMTEAENDQYRAAMKGGRVGESDYFRSAIAFSPGADGYWARPHEMFARAFESYVEDTIDGMGRKSSYLVSGTKKKYQTMKFMTPEDEKAGNHAQPYPQGEERRRINGAIGKLLEAMREDGTFRKALDALDAHDRLYKALSAGPRLVVGGTLCKRVSGPYVGPRGGRWADPQHTVPWHEGQSEAGRLEEEATATRAEMWARVKNANGYLVAGFRSAERGMWENSRRGFTKAAQLLDDAADLWDENQKLLKQHHEAGGGQGEAKQTSGTASFDGQELRRLASWARRKAEKPDKYLEWPVQFNPSPELWQARESELARKRKGARNRAQKQLFVAVESRGPETKIREHAPDPTQQLGLFGKSVLPILYLLLGGDTLEKALSHKYIRRVPYTDSKGRRRYRYFYRESAVGRGPQEGESVRVGESKTVTVKHVDEDGAVTIVDGDHERKVKPDEWAGLMADHYGERYYEHAEKRARQAINAVLRLVPREHLVDLRGKTDKACLADLKRRLPEVYAKLRAACDRAGMQPFQAKRMLNYVLERRGWQPEARAAVIGSVLTVKGAELATSYRQVSRAAERLAAGRPVGAAHVQAAIDLRSPKIEDVAREAEQQLAHLRTLLSKSRGSGKSAQVAAALAQAMAFTSEALQTVSALGQAYPGAADRAVPEVRDALLEVQSAAPRKQPVDRGASTTVFVSGDGGKPQALRARYRLIEANEVKASHDPTKGFAKRGDYPEGVQERVYHRDKAEQMKVVRNAQALRPEFLVNTNPDAVNGPPVVTSDGVVLGGNSRTMSMQLAYGEQGEGKGEELKRYLEEHAHEVGFRPEDVRAMKRPVLVREVEVEDKGRQGLSLLVRQMNESFTQGMDPRTMQVALGRKLDDDALQKLAGAMQDDETLTAFLDSKRADGFVAALHRTGVIDNRNANQYMKKGTRTLNADGKTLVSRLLVGKMINDADLLGDTPARLLEAVAQAVPYMAQARAGGKGYDLSEPLTLALSAFNALQDKVNSGAIDALDPKMTDQKLSMVKENYLADMMGRHPVLGNAQASTMLDVLIRRPGPRQLSRVFQEYAKLAAANPEGQGSLMGAAMTPAEVFRQSVALSAKKEQSEAEAQAPKSKPAASAAPGLFGKSLRGLDGSARLVLGVDHGRPVRLTVGSR